MPTVADHAPATPHLATLSGDALLARIDTVIERARRSAALTIIETEQTTLRDDGIDFLVRWVSTLAQKQAVRHLSTLGRNPALNPFLPPEPALTVGRAGPRHLCVLNKFPVLHRHLLVITETFEEQTAALNAGDFEALAPFVHLLGGLGFYNGGAEAGASQRHKHLQCVPASPQSDNLKRLTCTLVGTDCQAGQPCTHASLPFRHAFVRLDHASTPERSPAEAAFSAFRRACDEVGIDPDADPMPPYNMLLTREWLMVVPRSREDFEGMSVNALGFAASLFVRDRAQIERLRAVGPLTVLRGVAYPRIG